MYVNASTNIMDRPNYLICHFLSCAVFPAELHNLFSSLYMEHGVYIV